MEQETENGGTQYLFFPSFLSPSCVKEMWFALSQLRGIRRGRRTKRRINLGKSRNISYLTLFKIPWRSAEWRSSCRWGKEKRGLILWTFFLADSFLIQHIFTERPLWAGHWGYRVRLWWFGLGHGGRAGRVRGGPQELEKHTEVTCWKKSHSQLEMQQVSKFHSSDRVMQL